MTREDNKKSKSHLSSKQIRQKFLNFFKSKKHKIVPAAPIINREDPSLMFTNSGMNQFKDIFLNNKPIEYPRVADSQPCLRVSGKHNDLEEVGFDTYHHTLFEMLGNWSFEDYFKKEAISWAWELLTTIYNLPIDRLYVTVFEGDKKDNLLADDEAYEIWKEFVGEDRILFCSKKDNFWEMGDTGPCGPCSEIHIDMRSEEEISKIPGRDLINKDHPQVIEIWNLVFIQYNRLKSGKLMPLANKHIDTGMGFERLVMAIQKAKSTYDTDIFKGLIDKISEEASTEYGQDPKKDIAIRVIADHIRAVTLAIADGEIPSNNKVGYVIRRILRRAIRYAYSYLEIEEPFIYQLIPIVSEFYEEIVPGIMTQKDYIQKIIKEEEMSFIRTLSMGLKRVEHIMAETTSEEKIIDGQSVFELYDRYGFPVDLTRLISKEKGFEIDEAGFEKEMAIQKNRSKQASNQSLEDWVILDNNKNQQFIGYDHLTSESKIIKYQRVESKGMQYYKVVFDKTPFYSEGGGQIGDTGVLLDKEKKYPIQDTKKENGIIISNMDRLPDDIKGVFRLEVNTNKRNDTAKNHSATHLLHSALRTVLGAHVSQKGSLVNEKLLRFDFSHFSKMTPEEIAKVEEIVNQKIRENIKLNEERNVPIEEAKKRGAMSLFGEKYGENVRIITFDDEFSKELCGGIHVRETSQIGYFKIISETSIASGTRRIEALTDKNADKYINLQLQKLTELKNLFGNPKDLAVKCKNTLEEITKLTKQNESLIQKQKDIIYKELIAEIEHKEDISYIFKKMSLPSVEIARSLSFDINKEIQNLVMILAFEVEKKPYISVFISNDLVKSKSLNAVEIVNNLAKAINGRGGGQPFYAIAGGKDLNGLDQVTAIIESSDFKNQNRA